MFVATYNCVTANPCNPLVTVGQLYYPHDNPAMFVQCDDHGELIHVQIKRKNT